MKLETIEKNFNNLLIECKKEREKLIKDRDRECLKEQDYKDLVRNERLINEKIDRLNEYIYKLSR